MTQKNMKFTTSICYISSNLHVSGLKKFLVAKISLKNVLSNFFQIPTIFGDFLKKAKYSVNFSWDLAWNARRFTTMSTKSNIQILGGGKNPMILPPPQNFWEGYLKPTQHLENFFGTSLGNL